MLLQIRFLIVIDQRLQCEYIFKIFYYLVHRNFIVIFLTINMNMSLSFNKFFAIYEALRLKDVKKNQYIKKRSGEY
jgi:hypothetical protein